MSAVHLRGIGNGPPESSVGRRIGRSSSGVVFEVGGTGATPTYGITSQGRHPSSIAKVLLSKAPTFLTPEGEMNPHKYPARHDDFISPADSDSDPPRART